jgi:cyclophilin family peptidyl-prolyl cis-trans isomerase/HEAT repeat protein
VVDDDLTGSLSDPEAGVRAKAALALGQIGSAASVPDLRRVSADADPAVRASAVFALGLIAEPSSLPDVLRLAGDDDARVRSAVAEALGRLHDEASEKALDGLLADADPGVRAAAGYASWKLPEPEPLLVKLIQNLGSDQAPVRRAAAYGLARLGAAAVAPPSSGAVVGHLTDAARGRVREALAVRVGDTDAEVRMQVARGLSAPQNPAELSVVGALSGDTEARVRVNAVRALGFPGISVMPYVNRGATDRDFHVARAALESFGKVGGAQAAEKLNEIVMKLNGSWLRQAALVSLVEDDPKTASSVVSGLLDNPDPVMRASAAPILVNHREPWAIHAVATLMGDAAPEVVAAAIPLLVAQSSGALSQQLSAFFAAPDPIVRAAAAEAVGTRMSAPREGVETRADLFAHLDAIWSASTKDTIPDAKLAVLDAAAKAGKDNGARAAFGRGLADADVLVRRRAVKCLSEVYGEDHASEIGPYADRPIEDYVKIVVWARTPHSAVITMQRPDSLPGRFVVTLDTQAAPLTAWNFAQLAQRKFFDGRIVHRVVPNFVVQDGDPRGDGFGGPGYSIRDEWNPLAYTDGVLGMASDGKDTAGSQWFITLSAQPHLDGRYTSFGRVTDGFRQIVTQIMPADIVVSVRMVDEDGTE